MRNSSSFNVPEYSHTQRSPLWLILVLAMAVCVIIGVQAGGGPDTIFPLALALLLGLVAASFQHLTVEDQGEFLAVQFGPLPVARRRVAYKEIIEVDIGRTSWIEGWGIRYSIRGGWIWNIWGRDCVVIRFRQGGKLTIGTDQPAKLAEFLRRRVGSTV